jgi:FkbM family methyltransferase
MSKVAGWSTPTPWRLIGREILRRHHPLPFQPNLLGRDDERNLLLMQIGQHQYWLPKEIDMNGLRTVFDEIFNPHNGHYYECGKCRIRPGDVVLDAGACEGFFVRFALERGASVIAVEPYDRLADCLERTFEIDVRAGRVCVVRTVLGDDEKECAFTVDPAGPFWGSNASVESPSARPHWMTTIDSVVRKSQFGRLDFIKMDLEGAELLAIAGSQHVLPMFRPNIAVTTYHRASDCERIRYRLLAAVPEYEFVIKGVSDPDGQHRWRPLMLHGWVGQPKRRPGFDVRDPVALKVLL